MICVIRIRDQTGEVDRVFSRKISDLMKRSDLLALVGRKGDAMRNIENIHAKPILIDFDATAAAAAIQDQATLSKGAASISMWQ